MNKRGVTNGLIIGIVFGVASLVIGVVIALVITQTLNNANLLNAGRTSETVTNESQNVGGVTQVVYVNQTNYSLTRAGTAIPNVVNGSYSVSIIWADTNQTNGTQSGILRLPSGFGTVVPAANYTVYDTGIIGNATVASAPNVSITYSYTNTSDEERATTLLSANFTDGIDRVSEKIPTVLLIAAVVLIIGILAVLIAVWQRMRLGGGDL